MNKEFTMYKTFISILSIFWLFDVMNMPFMQIFDTDYPVNGWVWFAVVLVLIMVSGVIEEQRTIVVAEKRGEKNEMP